MILGVPGWLSERYKNVGNRSSNIMGAIQGNRLYDRLITYICVWTSVNFSLKFHGPEQSCICEFTFSNSIR